MIKIPSNIKKFYFCVIINFYDFFLASGTTASPIIVRDKENDEMDRLLLVVIVLCCICVCIIVSYGIWYQKLSKKLFSESKIFIVLFFFFLFICSCNPKEKKKVVLRKHSNSLKVIPVSTTGKGIGCSSGWMWCFLIQKAPNSLENRIHLRSQKQNAKKLLFFFLKPSEKRISRPCPFLESRRRWSESNQNSF